MRIGRYVLSSYASASGAFITTYHVALAIVLPLYFWLAPPSWPLIAVSAGLLLLTELGITGAYHRFYSHRSYAMAKPVEAVLLFLGTLAFQGSVLQWSHDHRKHHAHVDTDDDPYSIHKGFWYAHMLWLYDPPQPIETRWVADLAENRLVMFQHRWYGWLSVGTNALVFLLVGWWLSDFVGAFVLAWWTRLLVSHHFTWFINSLAHYWGARTYSREHSAVDNYVIAFLTVGEGYHNYHHTFSSDYRNGVRWYHFDPAKWMIWSLEKLGLAKDVKRYDWLTIRKRLLAEDRRLLLETVRSRACSTKAELEQRVLHLSEAIREKINRLQVLGEEIRRLRESERERARIAECLAELRRLKDALRQDWRHWTQLSGLILEPAPA